MALFRDWRPKVGGNMVFCSCCRASSVSCCKGLLRKSNLGVALKYTGVMHSQGFYVPPFAVSLLFKVAAEVDRVQALVEACLDGTIMMPHETITLAFEAASAAGTWCSHLALRLAAVVAASGRRRPSTRCST